LPPGFTLDVNAVAVGFDNAIYAGPNSGPPTELFAAINDPANWISSVSPSALYFFNNRPELDLDRNNSTSFGKTIGQRSHQAVRQSALLIATSTSTTSTTSSSPRR
jgi:hypothetical protein